MIKQQDKKLKVPIKTTISVTQEIWAALNILKLNSSETFIDVLNRLLKINSTKIN